MGKNSFMKKFAFVSDVLFSFFIGGLCALVLFRYVGVAFYPALLLALLCGGLTALGVGALLAAKRKNLYLKRSNESLQKKLLLHLALLSDEEKTTLFQGLLAKEEEPISRFGRLRLFNRREFFFLKFTLSPLSVDEIPNLARLKTGKKKILLCAQIEENALALCARLGIEVRTGEWTFALCKEKNALPQTYLGEGEATAPKRRVKAWFSRRNAKRFLVCGTLVLLLSRLTSFYYYYLLLGVGLLLAALLIRIFGYAEKV